MKKVIFLVLGLSIFLVGCTSEKEKELVASLDSLEKKNIELKKNLEKSKNELNLMNEGKELFFNSYWVLEKYMGYIQNNDIPSMMENSRDIFVHDEKENQLYKQEDNLLVTFGSNDEILEKWTIKDYDYENDIIIYYISPVFKDKNGDPIYEDSYYILYIEKDGENYFLSDLKLNPFL